MYMYMYMYICICPFQLGVNKIVTGHNADDIAETVSKKIIIATFMILS